MEQRDYLQDQLEKLGQLIAAYFGEFGTEQPAIPIETRIGDLVDQIAALGISVDQILTSEGEDLKGAIKYDDLKCRQLDLLAKFLEEYAITATSPVEKNKIYFKSLAIYELANSKSQTFDFQRSRDISSLKKKISRNLEK